MVSYERNPSKETDPMGAGKLLNFTFLQEHAYEYLRNQILAGNLSYDVIYSESQIAKEIGCSRTPVKDALTRLHHDRYIDIIPSKGFILHKFTQKDILDTFQIRVALESFCVISIMRARDTQEGKSTIAALQGFIHNLESLANTDCVKDYLANDLQFHKCIVDFVPNDDFRELYDSHNYRIENFAYKSLQTEARRIAAHNEHRKILKAIETGGIEGCYEAVTEHNINTYQNDIQIISREFGSI
ncbi:MAG: GntR family transcriptional regulator [Eubacteriales bacterium]|nr:GntR family transcriptional regulator [Eubacteriales bacterium]